MRHALLSIALIVGLPVAVLQSVHSQSGPAKQDAPAKTEQDEGKSGRAAEHAADEKVIRANIAHFMKAYNAANANAIAALFTPEGQIVGKEGNESEGRDAIARTFKRLFAENPGRRIEVFVESIRFIGDDLAIEVGTTKEIAAPNEPPEYDRYTVIHAKRDGKWQMALARDEEGPPPSAHEQLRQLAWLVGDWVDDGGSTVVISSCRWSKDGNFLLQDFKLKISGKNAMNVSQRIGWDPVFKRIRSWVFDSEGGFGESVWAADGNGWIIRATGVQPDGTTASATNFLVRSGNDGYIWRTTDRVVGDDRQPSMEVKVVRKSPEPRSRVPVKK